MSYCCLIALVVIDPYKFTPNTRFLALFNEVTLMVIADGLFMFTDFVTNPQAKYYAAWYIIVAVTCNISINCFLISFVYSREIYQKLKPTLHPF